MGVFGLGYTVNSHPGPSKAEDLRAASVMIPHDFRGKRKSYTIKPPLPGLHSKLQILWHEGSIYVNKSCGAGGFNIDKKGGSTINVRKKGGWWPTWIKALRCAGVAWIYVKGAYTSLNSDVGFEALSSRRCWLI